MQTLREVIKENLKNYFLNLGSEEITDFYKIFLDEVEKPMLEVLINHTVYNQVKMAQILGLSRGTLRKKLKYHGFI